MYPNFVEPFIPITDARSLFCTRSRKQRFIYRSASTTLCSTDTKYTIMVRQFHFGKYVFRIKFKLIPDRRRLTE